MYYTNFYMTEDKRRTGKMQKVFFMFFFFVYSAFINVTFCIIIIIIIILFYVAGGKRYFDPGIILKYHELYLFSAVSKNKGYIFLSFFII